MRPQEPLEADEIDGLDAMVVAARDRRGHGECVQDGFFRRLYRGRDEGIHVGIGKMSEIEGRLLGIVGNDVRRGKG